MRVSLSLSQMPRPFALLVKEAARVAEAQKRSLYLVGGWIRDFLLGRESWDLDFAVTGDPFPFIKAVAERVGGYPLTLHIGPPLGRIIRWEEAPEEAQADFVSLYQNDIKADLRQRDYTCNALAVDALELTGQGEAPILDPLGGIEAITKREIVLTQKRMLQDDPVRILRAFRLGATLNFTITPQTLSALSEAAPLLLMAPDDRIGWEWSWILQQRGAKRQLLMMDETGVLGILIPQIQRLKEVPAGGYHHLDGFRHTIEAVGMVERVLTAETEDPRLNELLSKIRGTFDERMGYRRTGVWVLKFATLLHDIAKPETMTRDEDGTLHFYGHEKLGAKVAEGVCHRFRLSRRERDLVVTLVRNHMRPVWLSGARDLTERALRRFWRELGDKEGLYCIALSAADLMATRGSDMTPEQRQRHYTVLCRLLETYFALKELRKHPRLVTGHEIMERYGIPPCPLVGKALQSVEEAFLDGRIRTREEAWKLLDEMMERRKGERERGEP